MSRARVNVLGTASVQRAAERGNCERLVIASSSSVYGLNGSMPFSVHDNVDHPVVSFDVSHSNHGIVDEYTIHVDSHHAIAIIIRFL